MARRTDGGLAREEPPTSGGRLPLPPAPRASSAASRRVMQGNRSDSGPERRLRSALHRRGLRFRKHMTVVPGLRCRPDVAFTRDRLAVFVDGCFWHRCPVHASDPKSNADWWRRKLDANVARDRRNDLALDAAGWRVLRLWEHEPIDEMADAVIEALASIRSSRDS